MKYLLIAALAFASFINVNAQNLPNIELNAPEKTGGLTVMEAFAKRQSSSEFGDKELSKQDLSNLLWAANGINRENGKRTAPSSQNSQDIDIYVALPQGVYKFDPKSNNLVPVAEGDYRGLAGGKKDNPLPPTILYLVADASKYTPSAYNTMEHITNMGKVDAGIVSQNIAIFCSGMGLATKPRAQMNHAELKKVLNLSDSQTLILNHPVGYLE
ncbi:SagB/ThcOx family dehydrogenase [Dysgonomonas sp. GY617]|uniref:SagB/ThcOx family dehydrogenase n=1 Tax=Dysgonomonas sp. GY617 TaxID=2780420 RepID=UPI001883FD5F|nr:SagB/ThcOx family dehydrogenase [Dysgonomonas sp. GY617]MBF0576573.1 SagB/ThcOx family dehydrogenase [Dysgonomonas sp. GY617]